MLQDPNVERYIEIAVKPLKKEIEQMKAQIEALNQALRIHDVVGRSEQLVCPDCNKPEKEYRDGLCEMCHKWHTS
jgi:acetolactate synthase small subunit